MGEPTIEGEMESLRRYYGVPAQRGGRVAYTWQGRREGTIMSAAAHKLFIRFDDSGKREGPFHPTWEIEYLEDGSIRNRPDKFCPRCKQTKLISDFGLNRRRRDGHQAQCSSCLRAYDRESDARNRERRRQRSRDYHQQNQEARRVAGASYRSRHPERARAQSLVAGALRRGDLVRPAACSKCDAGGHIEAHHEDYSKPLGVIWLCKPCHCEADSKREAVAA